MNQRLEKPGLSRRPPLHPAWRAGQYVTYYLEREDGSWAAVALRVLGQAQGGVWALRGDFKTRRGECLVLFRSDPAAPADAPDPIPVQTKIVRESPASDASSADPANLIEKPEMSVSLAMNLLLVRRWPAAAEALSRAARPVDYPCGIDEAHLLVTPGPGYEKHHDLCPRVMLTGVACLSLDGGRNPMTVTSFGLNDPAADGPTTYDDFVDLSHPKRIDHEGFTLTYPATWFMAHQSEQGKDGLRISAHETQVGGLSCSLTCAVLLYSGDRRRVEEELRAARARLSGALPGLSLRAAPLALPGGATGYASDYIHPAIDGVAYSAVFETGARDRFALVNAFGCISRANPRRRDTMAEFERVFREILGSFQLR